MGIFNNEKRCTSGMNNLKNLLVKLPIGFISLFNVSSAAAERGIYRNSHRAKRRAALAKASQTSPIRQYALMAMLGFACIVQIPAAQAQTLFQITFDEYPLATATSTTVIDSEYETGGADNTNSPLPIGGGISFSASGGANVTGDLTV